MNAESIRWESEPWHTGPLGTEEEALIQLSSRIDSNKERCLLGAELRGLSFHRAVPALEHDTGAANAASIFVSLYSFSFSSSA